MREYSDLEVFLIRRAYESELAALREQVKVLREALEQTKPKDEREVKL